MDIFIDGNFEVWRVSPRYEEEWSLDTEHETNDGHSSQR